MFQHYSILFNMIRIGVQGWWDAIIELYEKDRAAKALPFDIREKNILLYEIIKEETLYAVDYFTYLHGYRCYYCRNRRTRRRRGDRNSNIRRRDRMCIVYCMDYFQNY